MSKQSETQSQQPDDEDEGFNPSDMLGAASGYLPLVLPQVVRLINSFETLAVNSERIAIALEEQAAASREQLDQGKAMAGAMSSMSMLAGGPPRG